MYDIFTCIYSIYVDSYVIFKIHKIEIQYVINMETQNNKLHNAILSI